LAGLSGLLVWGLGSILGWDWLDRWPIQRPLLALDGLVGLVLMIAAACAVYLLSQWRDKQLSARIQQELHNLNEGSGQDVAVPTTDEEIAEFARTWKGELGFGSFRAEELRRAARPSAVSPESVLVVAITAFFVVAMVSVLVPMEIGEGLAAGFVAACLGGVVGYVGHCVQVRRQAKIIERELGGSR
jgi:hypothetical protein